MNTTQLAKLTALARSRASSTVQPAGGPSKHATGTVVTFTDTHGTPTLVGKIHRTTQQHAREVHAYRHWCSHLGTATPRLLASDPALPGIVVTALPGKPLDENPPEPFHEQHAHHQAGTLLRTLHRIPVSGSATTVIAHLVDRAEQWIAQTADHLSGSDRQRLRCHMRALQAVPAPRIGACHLDFQPRNLLWNPEHGTSLIDFEHSRIDLAARDLIRLGTRYWPHRPDLKEAFLTGYGPLSSTDEEILTHCTALEVLTTLAYGLRHHNDAYRQWARTLLSTLD